MSLACMQIKKVGTEGGYAILFSLIIVSIISLIAFGISNTSYKQIILSAVAKDSEVAFYQADTASECALFIEQQSGVLLPPASTSPTSTDIGAFECSSTVMNISYKQVGSTDVYSITPDAPDPALPCFNMTVTRTPLTPSGYSTQVKSRGYNICDTTNTRAVERELEVNY